MSLVIIILSLFRVNSFAKSKDSVVYGDRYPVKKGYIYPFNPPPGRLVDPSGIEHIYSKEDDVFALMEGKMTRIFKLDSTDKEEHVVIVNRDTVVAYGNLVTIYKKVGDTVHRGELIGKIGKGIHADRYLLYFCIVVRFKTMMGRELIEFLKRYN